MEGFLKPDRFKWHTSFNFADINKTFIRRGQRKYNFFEEICQVVNQYW